MKTDTVRRGRQVVFCLHVHLVFVTSRRGKVLGERVLVQLREAMVAVCADFGAELLELEGEDDHLHLLVAYPPKVALATLVNSLKGVSARLLRQADLPELRNKFAGRAFWSPSYCAVSGGDDALQLIAEFLRQQRVP